MGTREPCVRESVAREGVSVNSFTEWLLLGLFHTSEFLGTFLYLRKKGPCYFKKFESEVLNRLSFLSPLAGLVL